MQIVYILYFGPSGPEEDIYVYFYMSTGNLFEGCQVVTEKQFVEALGRPAPKMPEEKDLYLVEKHLYALRLL